MKVKLLTLVTVLAVAGMASSASAQDRPLVAVMDFDYSAVNNWWSGVWGNYDIGKGVADMVVDELINESDFRVIERKRIDTVLAEQDFAQSDRADPSAAKMAQVGKVLGVDHALAAEDQGVLQDVLQFANIARIIVVEQDLHGILSNRRRGNGSGSAEASHDMPEEQRQVPAALLQKGQFDAHDVQAVEQVLAKEAAVHKVPELSIGRRDDAHIHLVRAAGA